MNVTTNSPQREIHPIEGLSPNQRDRTICAQVKQKSSIRNYSNSWKKGRLFDVTLMDETGEIRAVAFDGNADNFFPKLQEGKTYYISGAQIIPAKRGFATAHPKCELVLSRETAVDNVSLISYMRYKPSLNAPSTVTDQSSRFSLNSPN